MKDNHKNTSKGKVADEKNVRIRELAMKKLREHFDKYRNNADDNTQNVAAKPQKPSSNNFGESVNNNVSNEGIQS